MRTILTMLLLVFLAPTNVYSDEPDKTLHNKCLYPTVMVSSKDSFGTGFVVRSEKVGDEYHNILISCAHCFQSTSPYTVGVPKFKDWSTFIRYDRYPVYVFCLNRSHDLMIGLFKSKNQVPTVEFNFDVKLYIGSDLMRIGCGMGDEHRADFGKITSVLTRLPGREGDKNVIRTSVYSVPGDSGGPVFHKNKVIGITQAIRSRRENQVSTNLFSGISYCIPVSRLKTWSQELDNALDFIYKENERIPVIPFFLMEMGKSKTNNKIMSSNQWIKGL